MATRCANCGAELDGVSEFCHYCGSRTSVEILKKKCPNCGAEMNADAQYCEKCGRSVSDTYQKQDKPKDLEEIFIGYENYMKKYRPYLIGFSCYFVIAFVCVTLFLINGKIGTSSLYLYFLIIILPVYPILIHIQKKYYFPLRRAWRAAGIRDMEFSKLYRQYRIGKRR